MAVCSLWSQRKWGMWKKRIIQKRKFNDPACSIWDFIIWTPHDICSFFQNRINDPNTLNKQQQKGGMFKKLHNSFTAMASGWMPEVNIIKILSVKIKLYWYDFCTQRN